MRFNSLPIAVCIVFVLFGQVVAQSDKLPIRKVVLLNTGVGYFQHEGAVDGDDQVELTFGVDDINDLLKSMVLQDLDGGQVSSISYAPQDPNGSKLQSFDIDLTDAPTMSMLLSRLRGERVQISGIDSLSGTVIGVEEQQSTIQDGQVATKGYLNLLTTSGLQQISLSSIRQVKLENEKLDAELRKALAFVASARGNDKRKVAISFRGKGKRSVRIGYVRETPTWKTSYRLVLGGDRKALMQGWAIVENTGQTDWVDVQLSLASGNPISFVMDLYEPLFVERPGVDVAMFESMLPGTHNLARRQSKLQQRRGLGGGMMSGFGGMGGGAFGRAEPSDDSEDEEPFDASDGVQAAATAAATGQMFEYKIKAPVTLARMSSAMLPIIDQRMGIERVCIFNSATHEKHPLDAVRLKNTSDLHITRGPITVYDDDAYAGDALTMDIPPGSERLISYSLNSGVEVVERKILTERELRAARLEGDALVITSGRQRKNSYVIGNETTSPKTVLIEVPFDGSWKVVGDTQPSETTRNLHRFSTRIEPKESRELTVVREQITESKMPLDRATPRYIAELKALTNIDAKLKTLLDQLSLLQASMNAAEAEVVSIREQHRNITVEQTRIRSNLEALDKSATLYERYVKRLTEQEDLLEDLSKRLGELRARQRENQRELDKLLGPFRQKGNSQQLNQRSKSNNKVQQQQDETLDDIFFDEDEEPQKEPGGLF